MPLRLITGPPNSGRTERLRELFVQAERKSPVLVVPSVGDIFGWERRLTAPDGAFIGARVFHFRDLCAEIIRRSGGRRRPLVSDFHRRQIMTRAVREKWPEQSDRLQNQPGFLDSLLDLVDDFRTEEILTREELTQRMESAGISSLGRIPEVFGRYLEILDGSGFTDMPELISTAVRLLPGAWEAGSPLFMAGFDDLTGQQLEMVRRLLSGERGVDVTIAVTHEPDNPGTAVSNELVSELREIGEAVGLSEETFERGELESDVSAVLDQVSRRFLRTRGELSELLEVDGAVTLVEGSGTRNEAEAIGSEIARLLDAGVEAGSVGVALASPGSEGRLLREVLERYEIPVALEAEIPARATVVGSSMEALLGAVLRDSVDDLIFWLRSPAGIDRERVDRLEFYCRKDSEGSARSAVSRIESSGGEVPGWTGILEALDSGSPAIEAVSALVDLLAEGILTAAPSLPPSQAVVLELKVAGAMKQALAELSELEADGRKQLDALHDALGNDAIKVWSSPSSGAVTIASPYGMRGKRFDHLFMAGLQESGSHDPERPGPFLSKESREALGMSLKADREDQDRYLFYSCLTVPTERIWLCFTTSDETGKSTRPSPLVGAVEAMFDGPLNRILRNGTTPVFSVEAAPTIAELTRSAAGGITLPDGLRGSEIGTGIEKQVVEARARIKKTATLSSLENRDLIEALAGDGILSPTGIEAWARCPYRWYVEKAVRPDEIGPDSDYLTLGLVTHAVLQRLFERNPGARPEARNVASWTSQLEECLDEVLADREFGLTGQDVRSVVMRMRIRRMLETFLIQESAHPRGDFHPAFLEQGFGPIEMEGSLPWKLAGKIDRIDLAGPDEEHEGGRALLVDYKSGSIDKYKRVKALDDGLIQMILYLGAARSMDELKGATPVGGLYLPLKGGKARGGLESGLKANSKAWNFTETDAKGELEAWIDEGLALAGEAAARILQGEIEHDPVTCRDHFEDPAVPAWSPAGDSDDGKDD